MTPAIDWRISASLENVPRGDIDVAEVTSLAGAVRTWQQLDPKHQIAAILTLEHAVTIEGVPTTSFEGAAIAFLAEQLRLGHSEVTASPGAA